jgi:cysteinyl-tRNA synthetase
MSLVLYNTQSRTKETFTPITPGRVGIYFCGPTVYSEPHLGHARGAVVFDVLRRWLKSEGYQVRLVSNVTDVGHLTDDGDQGTDKLIQRAKLEQLEPMEVAEKYFWSYFDALGSLNIHRPDVIPRATGHIPEQLAITEKLINRGYAYERNGSVYFNVSAWEKYGELSGRNTKELLEGTRLEARTEKDDPRDFALWKRAGPDHLMRWDSPWGQGYPGWHLECTVMSTKYLGDEFDIHGGGLDLIFPHHECELAQARGVGMGFARLWMHWNMITLGGEKMAKSKGHFVTLSELFSHHHPLEVRFHLLRSHYRSVSEFSMDSLVSSASGLKRLWKAHKALLCFPKTETPVLEGPFATHRERFQEAMNDDLNTPRAIAVLFDAARDVNRALENSDVEFLPDARLLFDHGLDEMLGLPQISDQALETTKMDGLVKMIVEQRDRARQQRDFDKADEIRERLMRLGIVLEDSPDGTRWKLD